MSLKCSIFNKTNIPNELQPFVLIMHSLITFQFNINLKLKSQ